MLTRWINRYFMVEVWSKFEAA